MDPIKASELEHVQLLESNDPPATKINIVEKLAKAFGITIAQLLRF